jgi:predicted aspartyl protease
MLDIKVPHRFPISNATKIYGGEGGKMGDVYVEIDLINYIDRVLSGRGYLEAEKIRSEKVKVLADSGCTMLVLPQDLVEKLGLEITGEKVIVAYANEQKEERPVAGTLTVRVGGRGMETDCIVGPPVSEPLLGQIILERLDLLVDCREGKLVPRPESPYLPMLKMK